MKPDAAQPVTLDALLAERAWVAKLAYRMVRDRDEAEDVAQDAMLAALESPPPADRAARPWLGRVATNVVRQRHRSASRRGRREEAAAPPEPGVDAVAALHRDRTAAAVVRAVDALEEPYREAVVLRFVGERTVAEIAAAQGVPTGTAGWRISEGLKRLRAELDREAGGDARPWLMALAPGAAPLPNPATPVALTGGTSMMKILAVLFAIVGAAALAIVQPWVTAAPRPASVAATADTAGPARPVAIVGPEASPRTYHRVPPSAAAPSSSPGSTVGAAEDLRRSIILTLSGADGARLGRAEVLQQDPAVMDFLVECLADYYARAPDVAPGGKATLRFTIAQDEGDEPRVIESEVLRDRSNLGDADLRTCLVESSLAMRLREPLGAAGARTSVDLEVAHEPSLSSGRTVAAFNACRSELERRRPGARPSAAGSDPEFSRCMDAALGFIDLPPELRACAEAGAARRPTATRAEILQDPDVVSCLARSGATMSEALSRCVTAAMNARPGTTVDDLLKDPSVIACAEAGAH